MKFFQAYRAKQNYIFYFTVNNNCHGKVCYSVCEEGKWIGEIFMHSGVSCTPRYTVFPDMRTLKRTKLAVKDYIARVAKERADVDCVEYF